MARDGPRKSGATDSVTFSQPDPRPGKITAHRRGHVRARCVGVRLPAPSLYFLLRRSFSPKARLLLSTPSSTAPRSAAAPRVVRDSSRRELPRLRKETDGATYHGGPRSETVVRDSSCRGLPCLRAEEDGATHHGGPRSETVYRTDVTTAGSDASKPFPGGVRLGPVSTAAGPQLGRGLRPWTRCPLHRSWFTCYLLSVLHLDVFGFREGRCLLRLGVVVAQRVLVVC